MGHPLLVKNTSLACVGFGLQRHPSGALLFGLYSSLPGVETHARELRANPASFDEMTALASDAHAEWRAWGNLFDEVMFSYVPQASLF